MSDHSISIVPRLSNYPDNETKAKEILDWLVSLDIVKPTPSDCILSSSDGYAICTGAALVTTDPNSLPFDLITNGLEIVTDRRVFDTGENGIEELICPNCKQDISAEDWDFISEWGDNKSNKINCPLCDVARDIHHFSFKPQWGFSDLGFSFWNWPELKEHFIDEFKQRLDCEVNVVYTWI